MATDAIGNVLKVPDFNGPGTPYLDDEILASYAGLTQKGLTLETAPTGGQAGDGLLRTGTVLVKGTKLSGHNGYRYVGGAKAGVANAVGLLRKDVDVSRDDKLANVVLAGRIKGSKVKYTDDADGLSAAELISLASALGGRYDAVHDMLIF